MSSDIKTFRITHTTGFIQEISTLLIALQGFAIAAEFLQSGNAPRFHPGAYLTIEGRHLNARLRLPLTGPIETALAKRFPDAIDITLVGGRDSEQVYARNTSGFKHFSDSIFLPFLVTYYERYRNDMQGRYAAGRHHLPDAWQMAWAIRNAASHNGRVFEKMTQRPVSWRGLSFAPADETATGILDLVNGADLLVLMIDMEELRTGVSLEHPETS